MTSFDDVLARVVRVIARTFAVTDSSAIGAHTTSAHVQGWDSLSHAILLMHLEEEFGKDLPLDRATAARDVGELARVVQDTLR